MARVAFILLCGFFTLGVSGQNVEQARTRVQANQRARQLAALGRKMFFDPTLSVSRELSCASCHDPAFAYGPPNSIPVQKGGNNRQQSGMRAVPSLRYLQVVPQFTEHYFDADASGDDSVDNGPTGGLTWDGRVDRGREQARIPLLSPLEMANDSEASVIAAVLKTSYADELKSLTRGANPESAFKTILEAFEAWQQDYREFYPYSSKYDAWLAGEAALGDQEQRGLTLFSDPDKGDCARCHIATRGANGSPPAFTDYGLIALGVPRNNHIPANSDRNWYDLGMCGPERTDLRSREEYCGRFMTPSLRNVATRRTFFHNGVFHTLKEVIEFYAQRDTNPHKWYPMDRHGIVLKFNDLPERYRGNVETASPFGRPIGAPSALSDVEIQDIIAFLNTLTDGFRSVN